MGNTISKELKQGQLYKESKSYHTIRILNIFNYNKPCERKNEDVERFEHELINRILKFKEFKYHIDGLFRVIQFHRYGKLDWQRLPNTDQTQNNKWEKIDFTKKAVTHPSHILFTSSFNAEIDNQLREAIKIELETSCGLEPTTYYVYKKIKNLSSIRSIKNEDKGYFALLFFQVTNPVLIKNAATNPTKFFENLYSAHKRSKEFIILCTGLLKGDIEGFIFFKIKNGIKKFREEIEPPSTYRNPFFEDIMPLVLFQCKHLSY